MAITTINPYTRKVLAEYRAETLDEVKAKISKLRVAQKEAKLDIDRRLDILKQMRRRMESSLPELSKLMSQEMGKSVTQSEAEVKKCITTVDYIVENARQFLSPEQVETEAKKSYVRFDPLGVVLLVMPWNFPAWQVIRAAVPAIAAGNSILLKHASLVSGTSLKLEEIFGCDLFKSTLTRGDVATGVVKFVDGVSLTGSTEVGSKVGEEAGRQLKKVVLELGGSDPYIVLDRTNLQEAVKNCAFARLQNNGQSCIASKRFLVHESVYDDFHKGMKEAFSNVKIGDPLDKSTFLGPLSSADQKQTVVDQVQKLRSLGAVEELATGLEGNFVPPTIASTNALFDEEVFGPVAVLKKFKTDEELIKLANETPFGLGASVWGDAQAAERLVPDIEAGMVFINKIVASDPRLPFGGVKQSGVGSELSRYGILEFTSKRTVWIN
ncbi:MAG TPA: aldehyde dehydrogenase family protein [Candidatus Acidoferrales bacterium]|nr:aldehyde dehydrogenase family protein [Candidatus Acidoferrales bacterium]